MEEDDEMDYVSDVVWEEFFIWIMIRDIVYCNDSLARRILYFNTTERGWRDYDVYVNCE